MINEIICFFHIPLVYFYISFGECVFRVYAYFQWIFFFANVLYDLKVFTGVCVCACTCAYINVHVGAYTCVPYVIQVPLEGRKENLETQAWMTWVLGIELLSFRN